MTTKIKFAFLVLPQIHLMDLAGPDQAILEAIGEGAEFSIEYYALQNRPVTSAGLELGNMAYYTTAQLHTGDFLVIPGANVSYLISPEFRGQKELLNWIKAQYANGVNIVSVCAGAFVLGFCGLLDGITCTTHFKRTRQLQQLFPKARVQENILFTEENRIYTSAGIASGIDLVLYIIEQLKDSYFAHKIAREMVVYNRREGTQKQESVLLQFRSHIHGGIHKAQDQIIENISRKHSLSLLADMANMSERNFTRTFKKETGITVNDYIKRIRLEKIEQLLANPDLSKKQVANMVGLESERQLTRLVAEAQ